MNTAVANPPVRGRFAVNLVANLATLVVSMGIAAWYVPFQVHQLGPAAYGMVPLVSSMTSYMALLTLALNSAVGRTLTIALEQQDEVGANRVFNTAFWSGMVLSAILIIPFVLGIVYIGSLLRIPEGYLAQVRWLAGFVAGSFLLNQIKTAFDVVTFARNRFDLRNLVTLSETLTRVGLVVALFLLVGPWLPYVGLGVFVGTLISAGGAVYFWRQLAPGLSLTLANFDWAALRALTSTGWWVVVNQVGAILYLQVDLLVANRLLGPDLAGRYAAVMQMSLILRHIGSAASSVFVPTALAYYARRDLDGLVIYLRRGVKFIGFFVALPIGLLCGFSAPLLRLWLGPDFVPLSGLLVLLSFHLCLNLAINPLLALQLSTNHMRVPGIVTLVMGVGNLLLALFLAGPAGWGLYGIAAAGAIMLSAKNIFFTPIYAARIVQRPWYTFYPEAVPILGALGVATAVAALFGAWVPISTWPVLIALAASVSVVYLLAVWFGLLARAERQMAFELLPAFLRRGLSPVRCWLRLG